MKLLLSLAVVCGLPAAAANIACTPDTAANYIAEGSCTESPFVLKNFSWTNPFTGGNYVSVPASEVQLTPTPTGVGLSFQGAPGQPNPFNISGQQQIFVNFDYTIDPRPPILNGFTLSVNANSPSGGGFAMITALVCAGGTFADLCEHGPNVQPVVVQDFGEGNPNNILSANVDFSNTNIVDVQIILDMQANGGISEISGGGTAAQTSTPETPSAGLAFAGFAAMSVSVIVRRRRQP